MTLSLKKLLGMSQAADPFGGGVNGLQQAPDPNRPDLYPPGTLFPPVVGDDGDGSEIVVSDDPFIFENNSDITKRDLALESGEKAAERKGMFGVKGTLRDVLGAVGDAFLVQSGNDPMYAPHREKERMSDAMAGFTGSPMEAIERLAGVAPGPAMDLYKEWMVNQDRQQDNQRQDQDLSLKQGKEKRIVLDQLTDQASRLLSAAINTGNEAAVQDVMQRIAGISEEYGINVEQIGLDAGMTPEQIRVYANAGMTPYQQQRIPQMDRGLDLREESVGISASRAAESARAARAREGQAAVNERGRNSRAAQTDRRVRETSKSGSGTAPRSLRGSTDRPTSSLRIRPVGQ